MAEGIANGIRDFLSARRNVKHSIQNINICEIWGLSERIMQAVDFVFLVAAALFAVVLLFLVKGFHP